MPSEDSFYIQVYSLAYSGQLCLSRLHYLTFVGKPETRFLSFLRTYIYFIPLWSTKILVFQGCTYYFGRTKEYVTQVLTGRVGSILVYTMGWIISCYNSIAFLQDIS